MASESVTFKVRKWKKNQFKLGTAFKSNYFMMYCVFLTRN